MGEVTVEDHVDTSADRIWELVRDFGGLMSWNPFSKRHEVKQTSSLKLYAVKRSH